MTGRGVSHGCISVMNGIVSGTGAVIGIALRTEAVYSEKGKTRNVKIGGTESTDGTLAGICVRRTLERIGADPDTGYVLSIDSEIPPSRGLKSSSSVCNAVISAVLAHHGFAMDTMDMIMLGVECAKEAGVTVTGSFDDACGCELGGFIVTDNYGNKILRREPFGRYDVILCIPDRIKSRIPKERYNAVSSEMEEIKKVCRTDPVKAMTMNGRLIARVTGSGGDLMDEALAHGALAAGVSGTGPAVAVLAEPGDGKRIAAALGCRTVITETR